MVPFKRFKLVCSSSVMVITEEEQRLPSLKVTITEEEQTSLKRLKETITELSQCAVVRQMGIDLFI